ncbi:MAG: hypothetical protein L6Q76_31715 [Polyangiaceae bacterium]|nr:hypothetical protein [Polyangiaceae bacterium]
MSPNGSDLGATLVQCAKAPVRRASAHLSAARVAEGLEAVSHDNLLAGLRDGIEQTAKRLGASVQDVEKALPWAELSPVLVRITSTQRAAADIWQKHADTVGGLLTGFSGGTNVSDVRKQSAGEYLTNLAGRFVRDKHLHGPLKQFATDLLAWEQLIESCGDRIDHGELAATFRRRRVMRVILAVSLGVVLLIAGSVYGYLKLTVAASRERVNATIAAADPCAVEGISDTDRGRALPEQLARIDGRLIECKKARDRAKYEASCEALATHLEAGRLTPDDEEPLKPEVVGLLRRVAAGSLTPADFMFPEGDMPCQDVSKAADRLWDAYATAAANSSDAWGSIEKVSDKLRKLLAVKGRGLSDASKKELSKRAEAASMKAIVSGKPDLLQSAKALCDFNTTFGVEYGKNCKGVAVAMGIK